MSHDLEVHELDARDGWNFNAEDVQSKRDLRDERTSGHLGRVQSSSGWTNGTDASNAAPMDFADTAVIYQCVADRRSSFDVLLWSVPATGFGAQAFLFTTALAGSTARSSRLISMGLSLLLTGMTLQLFTRQLQAEDADRRWLEDWEERHHLAPDDRSHGAIWTQYQSRLPDPARHFGFMTKASAYTFWAHGMVFFGVVALCVLLMAAIIPSEQYLENCGGNSGGGPGL